MERHLPYGITQCHLTQVNVSHLNPSQADRHLIYLPQRDKRLSWPWWLVTYRDGSPLHRQSPIQVSAGSKLLNARLVLYLYLHSATGKHGIFAAVVKTTKNSTHYY